MAEQKKFLDSTGVGYLWGKTKEAINEAAGKCVPVGADGKIASKYLPSYVDDVVEIKGFNETTGIIVSVMELDNEDFALAVAQSKLTADKIAEGRTDAIGLHYDNERNLFWLDTLEENSDGEGESQVVYLQWDAIENFPASTALGTTFNPNLNAAGTQITSAIKPTEGYVYTIGGNQQLAATEGFEELTTGKIYVNIPENKTYRWSGTALVQVGGGGSDITIGTVEGTAYDGAAGQANANNIATLQGQVAALSAGVAATASVSPATIYADTDTAVTVTGKMTASTTGLKADKITISSDSELKSESTVASTSYTESINLGAGKSKTYTVAVKYKGMDLPSKTATVKAHNPVYMGMATSPEVLMAASGTKQTARASAKGTYTATAGSDGCQFYLLVPSDVTAPSADNFSSGGAPLAVKKTTQTFNGVSYGVFATYIAGGYNKDTSLTVSAN